MYERAVLLEMRELLTREKSCIVFYDSSVGSYVDVSRGQGEGAICLRHLPMMFLSDMFLLLTKVNMITY